MLFLFHQQVGEKRTVDSSSLNCSMAKAPRVVEISSILEKSDLKNFSCSMNSEHEQVACSSKVDYKMSQQETEAVESIMRYIRHSENPALGEFWSGRLLYDCGRDCLVWTGSWVNAQEGAYLELT